MTFAAADAHRRAGEPTKAEPLCQRVLQQWPHSEWADDSLQTLVQMAWDAGEYERVCALADRFAAEYPDSPLHAVVRQTLARADLKSGRFDAAIAGARVAGPRRDAVAVDPLVAGNPS